MREVFHYNEGALFCEDVSLQSLANQWGTPLYVYSRRHLQEQMKKIKEAFRAHPTVFCYAMKANSNLHILSEIFAADFGADIVSGGELARARKAGVAMAKVVYSGVGKTPVEIRTALKAGIRAFNVEAEFELELLAAVAAEMNSKAPICLRLNPHVVPGTHAKIATGHVDAKFGLTAEQVKQLADRIAGNQFLELVGLSCHIGSQLLSVEPIREAARQTTQLARECERRGHSLSIIDLGGGLGIRYRDENPPSIDDYAKAILPFVSGTSWTLVLEPGRWIVGNAGVLLTRVLGIKKMERKEFCIVDAGMNDLMRPALYDAYHEIIAVQSEGKSKAVYDIAGPVCESSDVFGENRTIEVQKAGNLLCIKSCGAYGMSMASQYNSRSRPAEVLVDAGRHTLIRARETEADLWRGE